MAFSALPVTQQQGLLRDVENLKGFSADQKAQFSLLKSLVVFGFFTSETGATVALNYLAVPGGFTGSLPYNEKYQRLGFPELLLIRSLSRSAKELL